MVSPGWFMCLCVFACVLQYVNAQILPYNGEVLVSQLNGRGDSRCYIVSFNNETVRQVVFWEMPKLLVRLEPCTGSPHLKVSLYGCPSQGAAVVWEYMSPKMINSALNAGKKLPRDWEWFGDVELITMDITHQTYYVEVMHHPNATSFRTEFEIQARIFDAGIETKENLYPLAHIPWWNKTLSQVRTRDRADEISFGLDESKNFIAIVWWPAYGDALTLASNYGNTAGVPPPGSSPATPTPSSANGTSTPAPKSGTTGPATPAATAGTSPAPTAGSSPAPTAASPAPTSNSTARRLNSDDDDDSSDNIQARRQTGNATTSGPPKSGNATSAGNTTSTKSNTTSSNKPSAPSRISLTVVNRTLTPEDHLDYLVVFKDISTFYQNDFAAGTNSTPLLTEVRASFGNRIDEYTAQIKNPARYTLWTVCGARRTANLVDERGFTRGVNFEEWTPAVALQREKSGQLRMELRQLPNDNNNVYLINVLVRNRTTMEIAMYEMMTLQIQTSSYEQPVLSGVDTQLVIGVFVFLVVFAVFFFIAALVALKRGAKRRKISLKD